MSEDLIYVKIQGGGGLYAVIDPVDKNVDFQNYKRYCQVSDLTFEDIKPIQAAINNLK